VMFAVQVVLGVEAYMGKFAAVGAQWDVPPAARRITEGAAAIRTLHVLIGTAILASSVVLAVRVRRRVTASATVEPPRDIRRIELREGVAV